MSAVVKRSITRGGMPRHGGQNGIKRRKMTEDAREIKREGEEERKARACHRGGWVLLWKLRQLLFLILLSYKPASGTHINQRSQPPHHTRASTESNPIHNTRDTISSVRFATLERAPEKKRYKQPQTYWPSSNLSGSHPSTYKKMNDHYYCTITNKTKNKSMIIRVTVT